MTTKQAVRTGLAIAFALAGAVTLLIVTGHDPLPFTNEVANLTGR